MGQNEAGGKPSRPTAKDLETVNTPTEFGQALCLMRKSRWTGIRATETYLRGLEDRPQGNWSRSTIGQAEKGRNLSERWVIRYLSACGVPGDELAPWIMALRRAIGATEDLRPSSHVGRTPKLADEFQQRSVELDKLRSAVGLDQLDPGARHEASRGVSRVPTPTCILCGSGGVGKTQLAVVFQQEWQFDVGVEGLTVWAAASNRGSIISRFAAAARLLAPIETDRQPPKLDDAEVAAEWFLDWCQRTSQAWLVVLDDLLAPADVRGLWPTGPKGTVLVTTKRTDAILGASGRVIVPVGQFAPEESEAYLSRKFAALSSSHPDIAKGIAELARELGHLPLALAQAAAFISDRAKTGETCESYRRRFLDRRNQLPDLFPKDAPADEYEYTLAATVGIAIDTADELPPTNLARPVLEIFARLDPDGIPLELVRTDSVIAYIGRRRGVESEQQNAGRETTVDACLDAVAHLSRLSLATVETVPGTEKTQTMVRVHGLTQRAIAESTPDPVSVSRITADALIQVGLGDPIAMGNALFLAKWNTDHLWDRKDGAHEIIFEASSRLGDAGQVGAARDFLAECLEIATRVLDPNHPDVLRTRSNWTLRTGQAGDPAGAVRVIVPLIDDLERVLGPDHPSTLIARENLGAFLQQSGQLPAALANTETLLVDRTRILGPEHHATLTTRGNLVAIRERTGSPREALEEAKSLLGDMIRVLGADHADTLAMRGNIAFFEVRAGKLDNALGTLTQLLLEQQRILGSDHPDTFVTRSNRADLFDKTGDIYRAGKEWASLVQDRFRVLGFDHPLTQATIRHAQDWITSHGGKIPPHQ